MAAAGCELHEDLTKLAVMWFARVLVNLHRFWKPYQPGRPVLSPPAAGCSRANRLSRLQLVDCPAGQGSQNSGVLLWNTANLGLGRVGGSRRCSVWSIMCCANSRSRRLGIVSEGCHATYVGHPYFDQLRDEQLDLAFIGQQRAWDGPLVAILPGFADAGKYASIFRWLHKAAEVIRRARAERPVCRGRFQAEPSRTGGRTTSGQRFADRGARRAHGGN